MPEYRLDIRRPSDSALVISATDFLQLEYTRKVNHYGVLKALFRGDHALNSQLGKWYEAELWRRDLSAAPSSSGVDWILDWEGIITRRHYTYKEEPYIQIGALESEWLLTRRMVASYAETEDRTLFSNKYANPILMNLIYWNTYYSTDSRPFYGLLSGDRHFINDGLGAGMIPYELPTAPPANIGNQITFRCFGLNLYEAAQKLCEAGGGDFNVYKQPTGGSSQWICRFYAGQMGTDRTATVIFSMTNGNMTNPEYIEDDSGEINIIAAAGQGEGADRNIVEAHTAGFTGGDPRCEGFVNGSSEDSDAALTNLANTRLADNQTIKDFKFDVIQTPSTTYNLHYFLGDKVKAVNPYNNTASNWKIDSVALALQPDGSERVNIGMVPA